MYRITGEEATRSKKIPFVKNTNLGLSQFSGNASVLAGVETDYPADIAVHEYIDNVCRIFPDKTALIFNNTEVTYQQLNDRANQLAWNLLENGIKPGDVVALALERSAEMLIALLAILKAGAAYLPLDPEFPTDRIHFMLEDASAKMLVTSKKYKGSFGSYVNEYFIDHESDAKFPPVSPPIDFSGNDLAYILYTSGSTGKPKGVLISHRNFMNLLTSMFTFPGISAEDKLLAVTTISFDIAGLELFLPLMIGATVVIADSAAVRDGKSLLKLINEKEISIMQATPATWKLMLASGWNDKLNLKVLCCGEPLSRDLAERLIDRCQSLWNMYGPTETTIYSTGKQILKKDKVISIGIPINHTQIYILNEQLLPVNKGEEGEIYISGDGVAKGYLNRKELNDERFIVDPFKDGKCLMYKTGDLGLLTADDEITCLGRSDQQIKIRGYRIEPGEIEYLLKKHTNVKEAVVTARLDKGEYKLAAYLVIADIGCSALITQLKTSLKAELPAYMVPSEFHIIKAMPLTLNGKIDLKSLPACIDKNKFGTFDSDFNNEVERQIHAIWAAALEQNQFGIDDDFFDLGGHSLIAVVVMEDIERQYGKSLPISALYEHPTIRKLAALIETDIEEKIWSSLVAIKPSGNKTPVYIIHGDGLNVLNFRSLALYVDAEQPVYGLQAKSLNNPDAEIGTIQQIASDYVAEIISQNPNGPYALAGYSLGGYLGLEMARILTNMGKEVQMLAMIDSYAQNSESQLPGFKKLQNKTLRQIPKANWFMRSLFTNPVRTIAYQTAYIKRKVKGLLINSGVLKELKPDSLLTQIDAVTRKYHYAADTYHFTPYDGKIFLLKAKERIYFVDDFEFLNWDKYAMQGVEVYDIPGDHKTIFDAPNDRVLAQKLQEILDKSKGRFMNRPLED